MRIELDGRKAKKMARTLEKFFGVDPSVKVNRGKALEAVSQMLGFKSWDEFSAALNAPCAKFEASEAEGPVLAVALTALNQINAIPNKLNGGDWDEIEEARKIAQDAIKVCAGHIAPDSTVAYTANLVSVLGEAVAYERENFADVDADINGADLVDWFGMWRQRAHSAITSGLASAGDPDEVNHHRMALQAELLTGVPEMYTLARIGLKHNSLSYIQDFKKTWDFTLQIGDWVIFSKEAKGYWNQNFGWVNDRDSATGYPDQKNADEALAFIMDRRDGAVHYLP